MTIHKGLGIKIIKEDGKGKGNRVLGESKEDYTVLVSIKKKHNLEIGIIRGFEAPRGQG